MTNTLHRYSDHYAFERITNPEPVQDDYIVFAMSSRGINDDNLVEKYRTGRSVQVYYDPGNLTRCVLEPGVPGLPQTVRTPVPHPEDVPKVPAEEPKGTG